MTATLQTYPVQHITQRPCSFLTEKPAFLLNFELEGATYNLFVEQNDYHQYVPLYVHHAVDAWEDEPPVCPVCKCNGISCEELERNIEDLFYSLIDHPSIRMHWLFLETGVS